MIDKILILITCCWVTAINLVAQPAKENEIEEEGKKLYKIGLALDQGMAIVSSNYPSVKNTTTGVSAYVSMEKSICIFHGNGAQIIFSVSFDSQARIETANVENQARAASALELELLGITKAAEAEISSSAYKKYGNSHFTILPLSDQKGKRAYVVTTSEREGIITFGNDHLLTFADDFKVATRTPIHRNLMWTETQPKDAGKDAVEAWHTHLPETGNLMTPTDIYTLLKNEKLTKWRRYSVISETVVSIWNCETDNLLVTSKQKWNQEATNSKSKK